MPSNIQEIVEGLKTYGDLLKDKQVAYRSWVAGNDDAKKNLEPFNNAMLTINDTAEPRVTETLLLRLAQDEGRLEKYLGDNPAILEALGSSLPNAITAAQSWQTSVASAPAPVAKQEYVFDASAPPPSLVTPPMAAKKPDIALAAATAPTTPATPTTPAASAAPTTPVTPTAPAAAAAPTTPATPTAPAAAAAPATPAPTAPPASAAPATPAPTAPAASAPPATPAAPTAPAASATPAAPATPATSATPAAPPAPTTPAASATPAAPAAPTTPAASATPAAVPPIPDIPADPTSPIPDDAVAGKSKAEPKDDVEAKNPFNEKFGEGKHEDLRKGEKIFSPNAVAGQPPTWVQYNAKSNKLQSNGAEEMALAAQNMGYTEFEFDGGDPDKVLKSMQAMADRGIDVSMTPAMQRKLSPEQREQYDKIRENNSDFKQTSKIAEQFATGNQATKVSQCVYLAKKGEEDSSDMALEKIADLPLDKFSIDDRASVINALYAQAKEPGVSKEDSRALKESGNVMMRALDPADRAKLVAELHQRDLNNPKLTTTEVMAKQDKRNATVNNLDRPANAPKPKWPNDGIAKQYLSITDKEQRAKAFDTLSPEQQKKAFKGETPEVRAIIITNLMEKHGQLADRTGPTSSAADSKKEADKYFESKVTPLLTTVSKDSKELNATMKAVNSRVEDDMGGKLGGQKLNDSFTIMNKALANQSKPQGFGVLPVAPQQNQTQSVRPR